MRVPQRFRSQYVILPLLALAMGLLINCSDDDPLAPEDIRSSRSYQGHASDTDINNFVKAYSHTVGTRLDDCQTCHTGGEVNDGEGPVTSNPCDYCHFVIHPPAGWTGLPASFAETLNPYGEDYDDAGRDGSAIAAIAGLDSDGDGFDRFISESGRDGNETVQDNWTAGINWSPLENLRLQLNYIDKNATNEFESDIDDNILYMNFQFDFDAGIL